MKGSQRFCDELLMLSLLAITGTRTWPPATCRRAGRRSGPVVRRGSRPVPRQIGRARLIALEADNSTAAGRPERDFHVRRRRAQGGCRARLVEIGENPRLARSFAATLRGCRGVCLELDDNIGVGHLNDVSAVGRCRKRRFRSSPAATANAAEIDEQKSNQCATHRVYPEHWVGCSKTGREPTAPAGPKLARKPRCRFCVRRLES